MPCGREFIAIDIRRKLLANCGKMMGVFFLGGLADSAARSQLSVVFLIVPNAINAPDSA